MIREDLTIDFYVDEYKKTGFVKIPNLFKMEIFNDLKEESLKLLDDYSKRKNFIMEETNSTLRKISTVSGKVIYKESSLIAKLYETKELLYFLEKIAGKKLFLTPDIADRHAIHRLHKKGDEHGAHVDTYPYVLITCIGDPGELGGGELKYVPNSLDMDDLATDKSITEKLLKGESYFMHASESVHCVLPLQKDTNRTVLVFTYADAISKEVKESYSSNKLYD